MSAGAEGEPAVVMLHLCELPQPHAYDRFDLKGILSAQGERVAGWQWWMDSNSEVNSTGAEHADPSAEAIWKLLLELGNWGQRQGIWLSGQEIDRFARTIWQTIDGEFQAFPMGIEPQSVTMEELWRASFPQSRAEVIMSIRSGCLFEVYAKHPQDIARLRTRFPEMRLPDSTHYW